MSAYTIIVPDSNVLQRVCGTNDSNLKLIESYLGEPLFACGNELSIDGRNPENEQKFNFIINRILDEIADGSSELSDCELVESVLNTVPCSIQRSSEKDHELFVRNSITVSGGLRRVYPKTKGQSDFIQLMRSCDMVFAIGPAGSGKTFLAVAEALRLLLSHQVNTIILTRPVVEAGESLGYLPGALEDKINPYIRPLFDAMNAILPRETVKKLCESSAIEVAPLAYMRGRTLNDCAVILDEAQNTTLEQMKMFLTRLGENSKMFITGDITQVDLPKRVSSGLIHALNILNDVPGIAIKKLTAEDVVRNELVRKIISAYENEERQN